MSNSSKCSIRIKQENEEELNVQEIYKETYKVETEDHDIKQEIKEEPVEVCENVNTLEQNIDSALETGTLGVAGKYILYHLLFSV